VNKSLASQPWAVLRSHFENYDSDDVDLSALADPDDIEQMYAARHTANPQRGSLAVVPIFGPITKRDSVLSLLFGGTSVNRLMARFAQIAADDSITTVLLNVDSPGGSVEGMPEVAAEIRKLREAKRVIALSNPLAASAAYWIAAQAETIIATPEALTGSIGVFAVHEDMSGMLEQVGIDVEYISSTPEKVEGNPTEALSDEARAHMQSLVDSAMDLFVADVAKGRSISAKTVRTDFGRGRVLDAKSAKAAGLVDRIATYTDTLARLTPAKRGGAISAEAQTVLDAADETIVSDDVSADTEQARRDRLEVDLDKWRFNR